MNIDQDAQEIRTKVSSFETDHSKQLGDFGRNSKLYRVIPTKQRKEHQSNTFYPELTTEVEALATAVHEMVFSDSSDSRFFQFLGQGDPDSDSRAYVSEAVIEKQMQLMKMEKKLLPFLRKLILQGTYPMDVRWHVKNLLKTGQLFFFDGVCEPLIEEMEAWKWGAPRAGREIPARGDDHYLDAKGYALYWLYRKMLSSAPGDAAPVTAARRQSGTLSVAQRSEEADVVTGLPA